MAPFFKCGRVSETTEKSRTLAGLKFLQGQEGLWSALRKVQFSHSRWAREMKIRRTAMVFPAEDEP